MKKSSRVKGLTLVELVLTVVLTGILATGLIQATYSQIHQTVQMRDSLVALNIARLKMSEVRVDAYPATGTTTPASDPAFPGFIIQQVVTSVATNGARSVRQVEINVARSGGSFSAPLVRLVSQLTSVATFGDGV